MAQKNPFQLSNLGQLPLSKVEETLRRFKDPSNNKRELMSFILDLSKRLGINFDDSATLVAQAYDDNLLRYPLEGKTGCVLIVSNSFVSDREKQRKDASEKDVKNMVQLWKHDIGCDLFDIRLAPDAKEDKAFDESIEKRKAIRKKLREKQSESDAIPYENLTAVEMKELLKSFSEIEKDYAYIVVIISTHGGLMSEAEIKKHERQNVSGNSSQGVQGGRESAESRDASTVAVFLGEDGKPVREKEFIELFYNDKNEHLRGIPKFFILDYCRGVPKPKQGKSSKDGPVSESLPPKLPLMSDMLTAYATHRFYEAFDGKDGSWLITAIHDVFRVYYKEKNVVDMLTKVNNKIKDRAVDNAMSVFESSLVKDFCLWEEKPRDDNTIPPPSKIQKN